MSAQARCDQTAVISMSPAACAATAASTSAGQSVTVAPPRDMPVSALRCTRAGLPADRAAAVIRPSVPRVPTQRSTPRPMASACDARGSSIRHSTGAVIPASRSARASGTPTTASQSAPPARAAVAAGTMPCP